MQIAAAVITQSHRYWFRWSDSYGNLVPALPLAEDWSVSALDRFDPTYKLEKDAKWYTKADIEAYASVKAQDFCHWDQAHARTTGAKLHGSNPKLELSWPYDGCDQWPSTVGIKAPDDTVSTDDRNRTGIQRDN